MTTQDEIRHLEELLKLLRLKWRVEGRLAASVGHAEKVDGLKLEIERIETEIERQRRTDVQLRQ